MKKLILISFIAAFSFGFTLTSDSNRAVESDCPYLNKIHSESYSESDECPYLEGKISKESNSKMKSSKCPYTGSAKKSETDCPYLKEKSERANEEIKPTKIINLKSS